MESRGPVYKKDLLGIGNAASSVGLCTLWTEKEKVLRDISKDNYYIAGQCYSKQEGVNLIIRNCLANKNIRQIVLCGVDLGKSGDIFVALSKYGLDGRKVIGTNCDIDEEIPIEAVERFRKNVEIIDKRDIRDYKVLNDFLSGLPCLNVWGEPEFYEKHIPKKPDSYPSEGTGFVVRGKKVGDVWLKILDYVLKFGHIKKSHHGDDQQEIVGLISVVSDEDPDNIDWKDYFQFTKEHFEVYQKQLMTDVIEKDLSYTYGSRLRDFEGINQIDSLVEELKRARYSRRAVAITWNVEKDHDNVHSPCLDVIQALVQDKLHITAYFRSNDMFGAWPENALALRKVQYEVAERVGVEVGDLIIISNSAHIYSSNWEEARKIVRENSLNNEKCSDPRGNVLIDVENGKIKISHLDPDGKKIGEFFVHSAIEGYKLISREKIISQIDHALDIGVELGRAEIALKKGLKYVQDRGLDD